MPFTFREKQKYKNNKKRMHKNAAKTPLIFDVKTKNMLNSNLTSDKLHASSHHLFVNIMQVYKTI